MADTPDLGSGAARHGGSSPSTRTQLIIKQLQSIVTAFLLLQNTAFLALLIGNGLGMLLYHNTMVGYLSLFYSTKVS